MKRTVAAIVVLSLLIAFMAGCKGPEATPGDTFDESGDTAIWALGHDASYLDPGYGYSGEDIYPAVHIFDTLVNYDFTGSDVTYRPNLATEWSCSEDGKVWTFQLRDDVVFHDGTPFNAEAVVFSFKRLYDETHPHYVEGRWSYFVDLLGDVLDDVVADGDYTIKITLKRPFAPLLVYLGYYSQSIVSPTAVEKYGEDFFKNPVGTGPFKLEEWRKDDRIVLVPFEDYWGEKPNLDKIVFRVIPEVSTRLAELETGGVHVFQSPPVEQISKIRSNSALAIETFLTGQLSYMAINNERIGDVRIRRALAHAINWDKMVDVIWGELGQTASTLLPEGILGFHEGLEPYEYDPEKAKALLTEAGVPEGFELTVVAPNAPRWSHPDPITGLEMVQSDLGKVGITVIAQPLEMGAWSAATDGGEYDLAFSGWMDVPDPNNFLHTLLVMYGTSRWRYQDPIIEDLALKAASTYDEEERAGFYEQIQEIVYADVPAIPIAYGNAVYARAANLKGIEVPADGILRLHSAYLE